MTVRLNDRSTLLMAAVLILVATPGFADVKVQFKATAEPDALRVGEALILHVDAVIPAGYHLYSMTKITGPDGTGPRRLKIEVPDRFEPLGQWRAPNPKKKYEDAFKTKTESYEGRVRHSRKYRLKTADEGRDILTVKGQICDIRQCLSFKEKIDVALAVESGSARDEHKDTRALEGVSFSDAGENSVGVESGEDDQKQDPRSSGMLGYLIFAFLAGLGALLTPCVFPMIPITVSFFTKFSEVSMKRSALMASVYTGSIVLTFTLVGVLVSVIFGAVGMQTLSTSTVFNLFLFALLVFFAFNLFGLFEIAMPIALIDKVSSKERELTSEDGGGLHRQLMGVFMMALTFTLVSFTCTVGFVGLVLAEAAQGNWFYPTIGMFAFSTAFSLPFFLLAMFPAYATKLQGKGGDWMVAVKVILGFLELAAAFKFLSNVDLTWDWGIVTRPLVLAAWAGIFSIAGLYLLRVFSLPHSSEGINKVNPLRMCVGILFFALAIHCASGMRDTRSMGGWLDAWLPPAIYPGQELAHSGGENGGHLSWIQNNIDKGMADAKEADRPLFIDFTGYSCANCRLMEMSVFPRPDVRSRLEKMVRVAAYTDGSGEREAICDKQREIQIKRFKTAALPFYVIIDPHNDEALATFADMARDPKNFIRFLDKGLSAFEKRKAKRQTKETHTPSPVAKSDGQEPLAGTTGALGGEKKPQEPDPPDAIPVIELNRSGPVADLAFSKTEGGAPVSLSSMRGKWVLLNFWASWCAPCKKELRNDFPSVLKDVHDIQLVTVAFDEEENRQAVRDFVKTIPIEGAIHLFAGVPVDLAKLPEAFGEQDENFPVNYLLDPKGRIVWTKSGKLHAAELKKLLEARAE